MKPWTSEVENPTMNEVQDAYNHLLQLVEEEKVNACIARSILLVLEYLIKTEEDLEKCTREMNAVSAQLAYTYYLISLPMEAFGPSGDNGTSPLIQ